METVRHLGPGQFILGADTVVMLDDRMYGKPANSAEAAACLAAFPGRTHTVITALALLAADSDHVYERRVEARVTVKNLSAADIAWYIGTDEWRGAAGGYRAQGQGARFLAKIDGDESTVIGLPEEPLIGLLKEAVMKSAMPRCSAL